MKVSPKFVVAGSLITLVVGVVLFFSLRHAFTSAFNSVEGRAKLDRELSAAVHELGPGFRLKLEPPLARGFFVTFPRLAVLPNIAEPPLLEFRGSSVQLKMFPSILRGRVSVQTQLREARTNGVIDITAKPSVAQILNGELGDEGSLSTEFTLRKIAMAQLMRLYFLGKTSLIAGLGATCCGGRLDAKGELDFANKKISSGAVHAEVRGFYMRLPMLRGGIRFSDAKADVVINEQGWTLRKPITMEGTKYPVKLMFSKARVDASLIVEVTGPAALIDPAATMLGCTVGTSYLSLTLTEGGWHCV